MFNPTFIITLTSSSLYTSCIPKFNLSFEIKPSSLPDLGKQAEKCCHFVTLVMEVMKKLMQVSFPAEMYILHIVRRMGENGEGEIDRK